MNRKNLVVVSFIEYDYPDIHYPIPFKQLVHNQTMRYVRFGEKIPGFPEFVKTGPVEDSSFQYSDCVIVTGCSSNHLLSTLNMMYSAVIADVYAPIVFVDYGIDFRYYPEMIETFRTIQRIYQSVNSSASIYYRKLNFDHFPSWWNISDPAIRGGYSWKVVSIYDVLMESKRIVVWSDGGNLFSYDFVDELKRVYQYGAYSPYSGDNLGKWVHHTSSHFLSVNKMVRKIMLGKGMCNGAFMLFDYNHDEVMNTVVIPYIQCAYTRKCISPLGTSRKNHRQDQAVVSVFMHSARIKESCHGGFRSSIRVHNDCKNPTWCQDIREPLLRNIESLYPVSMHLQKF